MCEKPVHPCQEVLTMRKGRVLNKQSVQQPYNLSNMDNEERDAYIAHQNMSHFTESITTK